MVSQLVLYQLFWNYNLVRGRIVEKLSVFCVAAAVLEVAFGACRNMGSKFYAPHILSELAVFNVRL